MMASGSSLSFFTSSGVEEEKKGSRNAATGPSAAVSLAKEIIGELVDRALFVVLPNVDAISQWLVEEIENNKKQNRSDINCPDQGGWFVSQTVPLIAIQSFIQRLAEYGGASTAAWVKAAMIIDIYFFYHPEFYLHACNVHRLILTAILIATKLHDDYCATFANERYAQLGGILPYFVKVNGKKEIRQINILEKEMLTAICFMTMPEDDIYYKQYADYFQKIGDKSVTAADKKNFENARLELKEKILSKPLLISSNGGSKVKYLLAGKKFTMMARSPEVTTSKSAESDAPSASASSMSMASRPT